MKLLFVSAGVVLLGAVILGPVVALLAGCAGHQENVILAGEYDAELNVCVGRSHSMAEYQACHCNVNRRWSRPCAEVDGGH